MVEQDQDRARLFPQQNAFLITTRGRGMTADIEKKKLAAELTATFSNAVQLDPEKISNDSLLAELGVDSLDLVEAVFQFEEKYQISIPFNANSQAMSGVASIRTVGDLLDLVTALIFAKRAAVAAA